MDFGTVIWLALIVLLIAAEWKIFTKAGQPGWACIIPIYGTLVMLRIIGKPWWWLLLMLIPLVNIVFAIWAVNLLSLSFGKKRGIYNRVASFILYIYSYLRIWQCGLSRSCRVAKTTSRRIAVNACIV